MSCISSVIRNILCSLGFHTLHMRLIKINDDKRRVHASCGWCGFTGDVGTDGELK